MIHRVTQQIIMFSAEPHCKSALVVKHPLICHFFRRVAMIKRMTLQMNFKILRFQGEQLLADRPVKKFTFIRLYVTLFFHLQSVKSFKL